MTTPNRRGPRHRAERSVERAIEAMEPDTSHGVPMPRFPTMAHIPFDWPCMVCGTILARTTIVPPLGTAMDIRCPTCGQVDRLTSDADGRVLSNARRVLYQPPPIDRATRDPLL